MINDGSPCPAGRVGHAQPIAKSRNVSILPIRKQISVPKARLVYRPEDDILVHSTSKSQSRSVEDSTPTWPASPPEHTVSAKSSLTDLPAEIQELIIDHIYGTLGSATSAGKGVGHGLRNWSMAMRHPRRKQLSDLSLVSKVWRVLIQQRLYRHIKIKGTKKELQESANWFLNRPHLRFYIKHIEFWVPVWEMKPARRDTSFTIKSVPNDQRPQIVHRAAQSTWPVTTVSRLDESNNISTAYRPATANATLDDILNYVKIIFSEACALTIEGGHCKKPRKISFFYDNVDKGSSQSPFKSKPPKLPTLPNISTLILKGAWNIIRESFDFYTVSRALPNLREWHCAYDKPKTGGYISMCMVLRHFPRTIVHLNLCLEGLYSKEASSLHKWKKIYPSHHICVDLGHIAPQLESLSYTGRVCASLFQSAQRTVTLGSRDLPRLKSIDIVVKNCCREDSSLWNDGTGINNWDFISRYEKIVTEGVRALELYPYLSYLRIRYIDLDSLNPLLNPYFQFQGNNAFDKSATSTCMGVWNDEILALLRKARPGIEFEDVGEDFGAEYEGGSRNRPRVIHFNFYAELSEAVSG